MSLVFDSSALLAFLKSEPGGDFVRDLLEDADVPKLAHAANLCEVLYRMEATTDLPTAKASIETLRALGIVERNDMDAAFWHDMAALIAARKRQSKPLALGDAFGVALARRESADFVTADRGELEGVREAGACRISFIR